MSLVDQITAEIDRLEAQLAALRQARAALQGAPAGRGGGSAPARRTITKSRAAKPRSGEQRRPPSGGKRRKPEEHPKYAEAKKLSEGGMTLPDVAKATGVPLTALRNWRHRLGWK